jgi:CBS domain-containing protein/ribosome-associated translation inhibitor RaiA
MIASEIRKLPVYREGKILGFITEEDVIHGAVKEKWGNNKIEKIMTKNPSVVEEGESLGRVLSLFRDQDVSHAPVVRNKKLVGIISIRDIIEHVFQPRQRQTRGEVAGRTISGLSVPIKGIMSKPAITVLPQNQLSYAAEKMREFDISSLVVATNGRPTGIVTKRDFLEAIAQMEGVEQKITLQFSTKDIEMDEFQRSAIMEDFKSLARRYEETLEVGTLFVYMKPHGTNFGGKQLIHCRLQLRTRKGSFFSNSEGWNVGQTFRMALDRIERQILRSKEFKYNQKLARTYLQRIAFPLTDL